MHKEEEKMKPALFLEGMTSIRAVIDAMEEPFLENDRRIKEILYDQDAKKLLPTVRWLTRKSEELGFSMTPSRREDMEEIAIGTTHGGFIAKCTDRTIPPLTPELPLLKSHGFFVMLEGIEDPYNFGYALRSLYAFGATGIILPERNWMTAAGVVARASAGASERLPVYTAPPEDAAKTMKELGYRIVCADTRTSLLLPDADLKKPILLIIGGERRGISRSLLEQADLLVKIPYGRSFNASLSAASAADVMGYEIAKQNGL